MPLHEPYTWELNHPLCGHPCPVTGIIPRVDEQWTVIRPDYRLRTGVLEPGIILSLPVGHTAIADTDRFFENLKLIIESGRVDRDNFVLIEDYTFHTGSDYEGRIRYIERMIDEIHPQGIVFFTRSYYWRLNIRLGGAFGRFELRSSLSDCRRNPQTTDRRARQCTARRVESRLWNQRLDKASGVSVRTIRRADARRKNCRRNENSVCAAVG
jgi:hypothetical protein